MVMEIDIYQVSHKTGTDCIIYKIQPVPVLHDNQYEKIENQKRKNCFFFKVHMILIFLNLKNFPNIITWSQYLLIWEFAMGN